MSWRRFIGVFCMLTLATAALAAASASGDGGPSPGVSVGWDGVTAQRAGIRYVTLPAGRRTLVAVIRVRGGRVIRFTSIRGSYGVPLVTYDGTAGGLSHDGRTLVLASWLGAVGPKAVSRFAVLERKKLRVRQVVTLRGAFSFDALSPDASTLYLIQYTSAQNSARYRVRAYDLRARRLLARVIVDRREPDEPMTGSPVTRVTSPDGKWVSTLYGRPQGKSFIHALDTVRREAFCLDLPLRIQQGVRLALTRDGKHILLLQRRGGARLLTIAAPV